jgi:hypothetical protein
MSTPASAAVRCPKRPQCNRTSGQLRPPSCFGVAAGKGVLGAARATGISGPGRRPLREQRGEPRYRRFVNELIAAPRCWQNRAVAIDDGNAQATGHTERGRHLLGGAHRASKCALVGGLALSARFRQSTGTNSMSARWTWQATEQRHERATEVIVMKGQVSVCRSDQIPKSLLALAGAAFVLLGCQQDTGGTAPGTIDPSGSSSRSDTSPSGGPSGVTGPQSEAPQSDAGGEDDPSDTSGGTN